MFGFFKKKQQPPLPENDTPASLPAETAAVAAVPQSRQVPDKEFFANDPYAVSLKRAGFRFLRCEEGVFEAEHLFNMISAVFDTQILRLQLETAAWQQAKTMMAAGGEQANQAKNLAIAETAVRIDGFLSTLTDEALKARVTDTKDIETLIKAFVAVDYAAFPLKPEACVRLRFVENLLLEELRRRGVVVKGPLENLQEKLHAAVKGGADEATVTEMTKALFGMLKQADQLYMASDMDFNDRFPHIAYDGRAELFTKRELAERYAAYTEKEQLGHAGVCEIPGDALATFFDELYDMGVHAFRLDNGYLPIDIALGKVLQPRERAFVDDSHRETRGYLLRELQYGYRIRKTNVADEEKAQNFTTHMLTMRVNAYRMLGRGLLYALLPDNGKPAVTYYSKAALAKAKAALSEKGLTAKALLAAEDDAYAVYEGPLKLRVVQRPGETMEQSLVCVFTDYAAAQTALTRFREQGVTDRVVALTWDEIQREATQCAGLMIDLSTYGRQMKKEEFAEVQKFRAIDKPIVMQFKKTEQPK